MFLFFFFVVVVGFALAAPHTKYGFYHAFGVESVEIMKIVVRPEWNVVMNMKYTKKQCRLHFFGGLDFFLHSFGVHRLSLSHCQFVVCG